MQPPLDESEAPRRSTRVRAQIPIRLSFRDGEAGFTESCHTLVVNLAGCGIRLSRPLKPGARVFLEELPNGRFVVGSVTACVSLGPSSKYWMVGVALDEPGNVWGIDPGPPDWGKQPAAAPALPVSASKLNEWPYRQFSTRGEFHPGRR